VDKKASRVRPDSYARRPRGQKRREQCRAEGQGRREKTARGSKLIYYWRKREIKCSATAREIYGRGRRGKERGADVLPTLFAAPPCDFSGPSSIFSISVPRRSPPPSLPGSTRTTWEKGACPGFTIARGQTPSSGPRARRGVKQGLQVQRPKSRRAETESRALVSRLITLDCACETYHGDGVNWIDDCEEEHVVRLVIVFSETTIRSRIILSGRFAGESLAVRDKLATT